MSSIEARLERDIAAVTKGVVVTERDLVDAQDAIDERLDAGRGRDRRRTIAVVAAAAVVVAGVGFGAIQTLSEDDATMTPASGGEPADDVYADFLSGEAPTPENLNGFWRVDNGNTMVRFQTDGTVQFSDQGAVISDPVTIGTYTVVGDTIAVTASDRPGCVSPEFSMRAALPEPGLANLVLAEPQFGTCATVATTIALEHVLPDNGRFEDFTSSGIRAWQPVTDEKVVLGDWMAEAGGGYLLEIADDETYYVADDSGDVVDNGAWRIRRSALELFSRTESPRCEEGNMLILGNLEYSNSETALRGTVDQNDCGGRWTPASWMQIPDATSD
jgi:hypothetical protein